MALFGFFGKKDNAQPVPDKDARRDKRSEGATGSGRVAPSSDPAERSKQVERNAARANATAKKIDAIESEMSSEFVPGDSLPGPGTGMARPSSVNAATSRPRTGKDQPPLPSNFEATLPTMGMSTEFLLGVEGKTIPIEFNTSEAAQVLEEAAILFANDQNEMVEQLLQAAIHDESEPDVQRSAWWMLFDLYQISGKQQQFENLSIDYASRFETSPPSWVNLSQVDAQASAPARIGATPAVAFSGKLDSNIVKLLERVQKLAESSQLLRLEFARVTEVDPIGCGLLLRILTRLQVSEHNLILVGAPELTDKIRAILQVGRRDETEAPWLLLLEILRLLNLEKDFEEASIDYCITFEVSPPAFIAPKNKVTTAADETGSVNMASECFVMPALIEGRIDQLTAAIASYAGDHNPIVLDCSRLKRVDFTAAGQMLTNLAPLTADGKTIEFVEVNHLIVALFGVMGLKEIVRIRPRKF